MTRKKRIHRVETQCIRSHIPEHLYHHLPRMMEIYSNLFTVPENYGINDLLKNRGNEITLRLFFDKTDLLVGFAIAGIQHVNVDGKAYAVFSAGSYSDLDYKSGEHVAKFAFTQSLKYKLKHPRHKLVYLGEMLSPAGYSLSARTFPKCYPHPFKKTPSSVYKIIEAIQAHRQYESIPGQIFLAKFLINRKIKSPARLLCSKLMDECAFYRYYFQQNANFNDGTALIIYIPLSLSNLFRGVINHYKLRFRSFFADKMNGKAG